MVEALIFAGSLALLPLPDECAPRVEDAVAIWWFQPLERAPGATVSLEAYWTDRPHSFERAPRHCVTDIAFSPEGILQFDAEALTVRVADDAPASASPRAVWGRKDTGTLGEEAGSDSRPARPDRDRQDRNDDTGLEGRLGPVVVTPATNCLPVTVRKVANIAVEAENLSNPVVATHGYHTSGARATR